MQTKVLFIVPYPLHRAPSQRFRVELYGDILREANIFYRIVSFMDDNTWQLIYKEGSFLKKFFGLLKSYLQRFKTILKAKDYDYIFIHREAAPVGPPVFEWICAKILRKKIIYDFDDAIWISNTSKENKIASWFKAFWKMKYNCKWAYKVSAGNEFLYNYARRYNDNVLLVPTCVNVQNGHHKIKVHRDKKSVVGWTGSHSTLFYLDEIIPVIRSLQDQFDFTFLVIADRKPAIDLKDWEFIKWNEATEQDDLLNMDIGIMPLKRDAWSEGKCGFKLIQYLACGIPAIADPIGVNKNIIEDGVNGYLCNTKEEWKEKLVVLIKDYQLRKEMGLMGREKIVNEYSIQSQAEKFLSLFS